MFKKLLDRFFKENTVKSEPPSAPAFAHFYLKLDSYPESSERIQDAISKATMKFTPEREEKAMAERNEIESAADCGQIIRFMRRHTDPVNQLALVNKAMEFEAEIVPELVRMLKTSLNDGFIETSVRILAKSGQDIADEFIKYFDDIRSPYAKSLILVFLGFKAEEKYIPWFLERHRELKEQYPDTSLCEGAYFALYELECRFYPAEG